MPSIKTKSGVKHFPYTEKGEMAAKSLAKKTGKKLMFKKGKK